MAPASSHASPGAKVCRPPPSQAQCFNAGDRERLHSIIDRGRLFGGFDEFNGLVRRMVTRAWPAAEPSSAIDAERLRLQAARRPRAVSVRRNEGIGKYELF